MLTVTSALGFSGHLPRNLPGSDIVESPDGNQEKNPAPHRFRFRILVSVMDII
jgi:hypothetical protein